MSRTIAFVTYTGAPAIQADDAHAARLLERSGVQVVPAVWNDPAVDWDAFDAVVMRSAWDYHLLPEPFADWLDAREHGAARVWNPPAVMRWNMDKRYLADLQADGVPIVDTHWVDGAKSLQAILEQEGWTRAVVKPRISASAFGTWTTSGSAAAAHEPRFASERRQRTLLVQKFEDVVETDGEWSFVFIAGELSHAVRKQPAPGDFRVQEEWGGRSELLPAPAHLRAAAERVVRSVPEDCLYARVDGCEREGRLLLMELELIEPLLFLGLDREAAERLAEAIRARV